MALNRSPEFNSSNPKPSAADLFGTWGILHFILKINFHCTFIEEPSIFSKLVHVIMKV